MSGPARPTSMDPPLRPRTRLLVIVSVSSIIKETHTKACQCEPGWTDDGKVTGITSNATGYIQRKYLLLVLFWVRHQKNDIPGNIRELSQVVDPAKLQKLEALLG